MCNREAPGSEFKDINTLKEDTIMNAQSNAALSAALPFLGSGAALFVMLTIGLVSMAGTMMSTMSGF